MEELFKELIIEIRALRISIDNLNQKFNIADVLPVEHPTSTIPIKNTITHNSSSPIEDKQFISIVTSSKEEYIPIKLYGKIEERDNFFVYSFARNTTKFQFKDDTTKLLALEKCKYQQIKESLSNPRNNKYIINDSEINLYLCNSEASITIFDLADLNLISDHVWYFHKGYAITRVNERRVKMTEILLGKTESKNNVSHANGNVLDNRRINLIINGVIPSNDQLFTEVSKEKWESLKEQAKKDEFQVDLIVSYLDNLSKQYSTFPLKEYTETELIEDYRAVLFSNIQSLSAGGKGHKVSFYFMKSPMLAAKRPGYPKIDEVWNCDIKRKRLWKIMMGLDMPNLSKACLYQAFTLKYNRVTNFPSLVAKNLYDYYFLPEVNNKRVLDFCSGYGGRFMGFYASKTCSEYVGIDPNSLLFDPYEKLESWINKNFNNPDKIVTFIEGCAEEVDYSELGKFDIIFTSPPYFNLEIYSEDETQSCNRYPKLAEWRDNFLFAVLDKVIPKYMYDKFLKDLIIYIQDSIRSKIQLRELPKTSINNVTKLIDSIRSATFEEKTYKLINKELSKLDESINKEKFIKTMIDMRIQNSRSERFHGLHNIVMDVYTLTRLFIKFDKNKMHRGPKACQNQKYQTVKNAIIYGGAGHIMVYISFFRTFFNKSADILIGSKIKDCIELDKPFDFFWLNFKK